MCAMPRKQQKKLLAGLVKVFVPILLLPILALADNTSPIVLGLNADMSSADAQSGRAIRLGAQAAIREINAAGGVLGRPLELQVLDHRRNPARGKMNMRTFANDQDVVAVLGGKHTPVILAELETVHEQGLPYLIPWAAGTPVVDNGYEPNFVFRLSLRDGLAAVFLADYVQEQGYTTPGLLLEETGWGRSNMSALLRELHDRRLSTSHVHWFTWGERHFRDAFQRLGEAGVDAVIFVGNAPDGVNCVRAWLELPREKRVPIISHWGIAGGEFAQRLGPDLAKVDLVFMQTFSFFDPPFPERADRVLDLVQAIEGQAVGPADIRAPTGVAHAYDLVHLFALAVEQAGTTARSAVREALEDLPPYAGLVRDYDPAFTPTRHEALGLEDCRMARFANGHILPLP